MGPIIQEWVFRILAEEVLGINTVLAETFDSSMPCWRGLFACMDTATKAIHPQYSGPHVATGLWMYSSVETEIAIETRRYPNLVPIRLGNVGYMGSDGLYVQGPPYQEAMQQHHLPLDIYMSYSHPAVNPASYFDSPSSIDADRLRPCNESVFADVRDYAMESNDTDGVIVTRGREGATYSAHCNGRWWHSPACRSDPSRCLPIITGGDGWLLVQMMQWAEAWQVPAAIAVAKDKAAYRELPTRHRTLFYWWVPDNSFVGLGERKLIWPRHNPLDKARTDTLEISVEKFACAGLEKSGISQALGLLENMRILQHEIMELGEILAGRQGDAEALYESVACEWLNTQVARYSSWIPLSTECKEQEGLVNRSGAFVAVREDASHCSWCAPGRASELISDSDGMTHRCQECPEGTFQKSVGRTDCELCEEGTFAAEGGSRSCQRCDFWGYAERPGQSACEACPSELIATTDRRGCICSEGYYRDGVQRGLCHPCKEGMTCPTGADMLGYQPEKAAQHPIVPLLKPGFWSSSEEPLSVFRCQDVARCPAGRRPGSPCAANFERERCGVCRGGYALFGSECVPCAARWLQSLLFPALPLGTVVLFICLTYARDAPGYERWGSWAKGALATFCILLNHYHVVNIVYALNVVPRQSVSDILQSVSFLSDALMVFRPGCIVRSSWSQLVLMSHSPAWFVLVYLAVWLLSRIVGLCARELRMERNRLLNGYLSLILTFFVSVTQQAFTVFKCSFNPNGAYTLLHNRSIICYEGDWLGMAAIGISAVLIWCVGLAALLLHAICVASKRFHEADFQMRWTFLFVRFRPDVHWWALTIVARGLILNMGSLFLASGVVEVYWIFVTMLLYNFLLFIFRPWRHVLNNHVDCYSSYCLLLLCAVVVWFSHDDPLNVEVQNILGEHVLRVVLAVAALPFFPIVAVLWWRGRSRQAQRQKETEVQVIMHAIHIMACGAYDDRIQFLKDLTEHDFYLMSETKDMLLTELGQKKVRGGYSVKQLSRLSVNTVCANTPMFHSQLLEGRASTGMVHATPSANAFRNPPDDQLADRDSSDMAEEGDPGGTNRSCDFVGDDGDAGDAHLARRAPPCRRGPDEDVRSDAGGPDLLRAGPACSTGPNEDGLSFYSF